MMFSKSLLNVSRFYSRNPTHNKHSDHCYDSRTKCIVIGEQRNGLRILSLLHTRHTFGIIEDDTGKVVQAEHAVQVRARLQVVLVAAVVLMQLR